MNVARTATSAAAVADRFRIEDEVWDDAFASRVSSRPRLKAVPKSRPAADWFSDPNETVRPYGVDAPSEFEAPFGVDTFGVAPVQEDPFEDRHADRVARASAVAQATRRTIHLQGRGAERNLPVSRREGVSVAVARRKTSLLERSSSFEPDKLAMWAMFLGIALMAVAILSSSL